MNSLWRKALSFSILFLIFSCTTNPKGDVGSQKVDYHWFGDSWELYNAALTEIENEQWHSAMSFLDSSLLLLAHQKIPDSLKMRRSEFHELLLEEYEMLFVELSTLEPLEDQEEAVPEIEIDTLDIDSTRAQDIPELVRDIDFSQFEMPIEVNQRVLEQIYHLAYRYPKFMGRSLNRQSLYKDLILGEIRDKKLPKELIFLPLVESGYKTSATSSARAGGIWQFIPSTARIYNMNVNWWIDERRSPHKSTEAGLSYLSDLYEEFGDWYLAMAAYNCGSGCVRKRIKNQETRNYWELDLPQETKNYVPRILAAAIIGTFPEKYGFTVEPEIPVEVDTSETKQCVELSRIEKALQLEAKSLKGLNPELRQPSTPPKKAYQIILPQGKKEAFEKFYEELDPASLVCQEGHRVRSGENLSVIAKKYGVSVHAVKQANGMRSSRIWPNQILYIPLQSRKGGAQPKKVKQEIGSNRLAKHEAKKKSTSSQSNKTTYSHYRVKQGENLYSISKKLGVELSALMDWNGLSGNGRIQVGQRLKYLGKGSSQSTEVVQEKVKGFGDKQLYRVKPGENPYFIAKKLGVGMLDLLNWNGMGKKAVIKPGDFLVYYQGKSKSLNSSESIRFHRVQAGDSLWSISRKYDCSVADLKKWNELTGNNLSLGQKLKVSQ